MARSRTQERRITVLKHIQNAEEPLWALAIAEQTGIPYGTVYPLLQGLADEGVLKVTEGRFMTTTQRRPRHLYSLTPYGLRMLERETG